jgi:transcriptional regulator of acetoin/glycerol metabolism
MDNIIRTVAEVEKEHILETVNKLRSQLDLSTIAIKLGIGKTTLYRKLRQWNIKIG